ETEVVKVGAVPFHHYTYSSHQPDMVFTVEVIDGFESTDLSRKVYTGTILDTVTFRMRINLKTNGLILGECDQYPHGTIPGRECAILNTNSEKKGKAQVFATTT